jgi:hypothetical protein
MAHSSTSIQSPSARTLREVRQAERNQIVETNIIDFAKVTQSCMRFLEIICLLPEIGHRRVAAVLQLLCEGQEVDSFKKAACNIRTRSSLVYLSLTASCASHVCLPLRYIHHIAADGRLLAERIQDDIVHVYVVWKTWK